MLRLSDGLGACLPGNRSSDDSIPLFDYQPDDSISHGSPLILRPLDRDETHAAFRNLEPAQSGNADGPRPQRVDSHRWQYGRFVARSSMPLLPALDQYMFMRALIHRTYQSIAGYAARMPMTQVEYFTS